MTSNTNFERVETQMKVITFYCDDTNKSDNQGLVRCLYEAGKYLDEGGDGYGKTILNITTEYQEDQSRWYLFVCHG